MQVMAESSKSVSIVPLKGSNYPTWKLQCRMVLMKEGLWSIVNDTEQAPGGEDQEKLAKFAARKDRALALIVLSVEPTLLYLLGDPDDPVAVWKKLSDQFQKKTWANKLQLRKRLYSLKLREGDSVQEHVRKLTEIFDELAVIGSPVEEEDRVVHLLASLPDSYSVLVTALEANSEVPKMEVVTERLLHEERKLKEKDSHGSSSSKALSVSRSKKTIPKCFHCGKPGHLKKHCRFLATDHDSGKFKQGKSSVSDTNKASVGRHTENESEVLVVEQVLQAGVGGNWIVDSGATCQMCCNEKLFSELHPLEKQTDITLGDGHTLQATGQGIVPLMMNLPDGSSCKCNLVDVLLVPSLTYNLLSVSKAAERGKETKFDQDGCRIADGSGRVIATAQRRGSLYHLDCKTAEQVAITHQSSKQTTLWHRRLGHLAGQGLRKLSQDGLVRGLNCTLPDKIDFCESCVNGKQKRSPFKSEKSHSTMPLELVHSDVCGKMNSPSLGGGEYFLTFIDDYTHYTWVYILKHKSEVFSKFQKWKALVENASGQKLKTLRTDRGGEYTSTEFEEFLQSAGVRHELTVPKTPEQNGVAERMNRTLVESVRSMLVDASLPHKFWAEALSTAVYLRNRSPTKAVDGMTPFEAWTGKKPSVSHLRVFGCKAFAHVPKDERGKLDSKAKKCILVGYGEETKGYRLYDPLKKRICFSRDVCFKENEHGFEDEVTHSGQQYVELDLWSEDDANPDPVVTDEAPVLPPPEQPPVRRSERERRFPDYYGVRIYLSKTEPSTVEEVLSTPEKDCWLEAMEKEMTSLQNNDVWELVDLPEDRKPVGSKWVFKAKTNADGHIERYKARLVAQGYSQKFGTDYDETFSPVVRLESVRTLIAMSVQQGLQLHQVDVTTAFLNGELEEEVYMRQPEGFVIPGKEHLVCKLTKSIYGLKQSPRYWNAALHNHLKKLGFIQTTTDPCVYRSSGGEPVYLGVYVDDIIIAARSDKKLAEVKKELALCFDIKDLGKLPSLSWYEDRAG